MKIEIEPEALRACGEEPLWDYSSHIAEFVNDFVRESGSEYADFDMTGVIPALTRLTHAIDGSPRLPHVPLGDSSFHGDNCFQVPYSESSIPMPPLEDAVAILRWAKGSLPTDTKGEEAVAETSQNTKRIQRSRGFLGSCLSRSSPKSVEKCTLR